MNMQHRYNDTDGGKLKYREKNILHCHFVDHSPHGLNWDRVRSSAVTGQRPTAWAVTQPSDINLAHSGITFSLLNYTNLLRTVLVQEVVVLTIWGTK
jgi:hypothetical protein